MVRKIGNFCGRIVEKGRYVEMVDIKKRLSEGKVVACIVSWFALLFAYIGAHTYCYYIFHESEKPDLSKLRKF